MSWGRKFTKGTIILSIVLILSFLGIGLGFAAGTIKNVVKLDDTPLHEFKATSYIMDKNGQVIKELHGEENRIPVTLDEISPHVIDALVAIEDQRFYEHPGIDLYRIAGAMTANIKSGRIVQGGSTITQQLVGLAMLDRSEKSFSRKIKEAILALKAETKYSKDEILERYLNKVYFGHGAYGIETAARKFFNKKAKDLNIEEAALLVGIIQNPYRHSPIYHPEASKKRRNLVLQAMVNYGKLSDSEAKRLSEKPIELSLEREEKGYKFQSFIDVVIEEALEKLDLKENSGQLYTGGYKIYTTLDPDVQTKMEEIYNNDAKFPQGKDNKIIQSAMVVLNHHTGQIKGLIGGRNQEGQRQFNRATQALRQPGSTFKPIAVFAPALEKGYSPATVLDDYPQVYNINGSTWVPKNYDNKYRGLISMRTAAQYSINVWTVKMLNQVGIMDGLNMAQNLGISSIVTNGKYNDQGLSLGLGGLTKGVSPLEITAAYGAFANKGVYVEPYVIEKIVDEDGIVVWEHKPRKKVAMSEETAYLITDMLKTVVEEGTGKPARLKDWPVAGKTGTTSDNKDVWFVGYTPELVGAVWLGYDQPETMQRVGGGSSAGPIWKEVMEVAHRDLTPRDFERPEDIVEVAIDTKSGLLPSELTPKQFIKTELFTKENIPKEISKVWVKAKVCAKSGDLPTPDCPTKEKVFLKRPSPWSNKGLPAKFNNPVPLDANLEIPQNRCLIHDPPIQVLIEPQSDSD